LVTRSSITVPTSFTMPVCPRVTFGELLRGFSVNLIMASFTRTACVLRY
jgi:hypothetical protein